MSSRQTGSRYMGRTYVPEPKTSAAGLQNPGMLASLLGGNKLQGGSTIGPNGELNPGMYKGATGLFGGQSRINAAILNQQLATQLAQQQHEKSMSKQEAEQQQAQSSLENQLTEHLGKSAQINAIATKLGIPVSQLTESIAKEMANNALLGIKNEGQSLQTPEVKGATTQGMVAGLQAPAIKNAAELSMIAPSGAMGMRPSLNGIPGQEVAGATPRQTTAPNVMSFGGKQMMMGNKTIQDYAPGTAKTLFPAGSPSLWDAAKNIQPPNNTDAQVNESHSLQPTLDAANQLNPSLGAASPGGVTAQDYMNTKPIQDAVQSGNQNDLMGFYQQLMSLLGSTGLMPSQ